MAALSLLADENVDRQIVALLRRDGHEVLYVAELDPGINDDEVLRYAKERHALLLTADKDFGELVYRQRRLTEGVVLFRLVGLPSEKKAELIAAAIRTHGDELSRAFTVISPGMVRIRHRS
jgi:predicted nuclease of predicted toxin-antitoxin system